MLMTIVFNDPINLENQLHAYDIYKELKTSVQPTLQQPEQELLYSYAKIFTHCKQERRALRHWKRNCPQYLAELLKKKKNAASGGEYMSQEFLDHLKDHGIIAHRTPPYTPQHNGVSERRNRTLLDMVRSMMSQTTLPKSFWDYALETAARILNMVPTKKVEKTPYEVWHGQAPKLSYLKVWGCEALVKRDTLTKPDKLEPRHRAIDSYSHSLRTMTMRSANDVRTASSMDYLNEEVYMEANLKVLSNPKIQTSMASSSVYLMVKQASRQWNKRFDDEIKKFGFTQNCDEPCVYLKASGSNVTFLILYVDDILIMGNNIPMLQDVKSYLGRASSHWRIQKRGSIPMQEKLRLSKSQGASTPAELKRMQNVPYAKAVGSIMYDVRCTRSNVAFAQNVTIRFQQNPVRNGRVPAKHFPHTSSAKVEYIAAFDASKEALEKVHTDDNLADPFTKALAFPKHSELTRNIGMLPASSLM
ncbi:retrotransposon protein, putative, ty1-copia subclass [Tanacetum coccineum]